MGYKSTSELAFGISDKQQTAYSTALSAANPPFCHPFQGDNIVEFKTNDFSNEEEYGTGVKGWATDVSTKSASTSLSLTSRLSAFIAGWVFGLGMGNVVTSQPDGVGSPTVYSHEFSINRGAQLPVTTIWEQKADGMQNKYRDMVVSGFTITGKTDEHLTVTVNLIGSGHFETVTFALPEPVQTDFLLFHQVSFLYGGTEIAADIEDFSFEYNNTVNEKRGYTAGCPTILSATGKKIAVKSKCPKTGESGKLKFKLLYQDSGIFNDALDKVERAITFVATGNPIDSAFDNKLTMDIPKAVIKTAPIGKSDNLYVYDVEVMLKWDHTTGYPFKITVVNDVPSYLGTE